MLVTYTGHADAAALTAALAAPALAAVAVDAALRRARGMRHWLRAGPRDAAPARAPGRDADPVPGRR